MKSLIAGMLMAMTLVGCVAVPVYEPAPTVYAYPSPPPYHAYYRYHYYH